MSHVNCHMSTVTRHTLHINCQHHMSHVNCHMSHVNCHVSHVNYQLSHVMCHMSHVTCQLSHVTCQLSGVTSRQYCVPVNFVALMCTGSSAKSSSQVLVRPGRCNTTDRLTLVSRLSTNSIDCSSC